MAGNKKDEAPMSFEDYQAAQASDWGQYVASERIYVGGALAFLPGDPVPAGHVTNGVVNKNQVTSTAKES